MSVKQGNKKSEAKELEKAIKELRGETKPETADRELTALEKLSIIAGAVQEEPMPQEAPKEGYLWKRYYDVSGGAIAWELVPDPDYKPEEGSYTSPIEYENGMEVKEGLYYTDGSVVCECIKSGTPTGFDDQEFFDIITIE